MLDIKYSIGCVPEFATGLTADFVIVEKLIRDKTNINNSNETFKNYNAW